MHDGAKEFKRICSKVIRSVDWLLQGKLGRDMEVARRDKEVEVCARSLMAFIVDKWRGEDEEDVTLEERISKDLQKMSKNRVTVLDVTTYKPQGRRPMSDRITLGSSRQKTALFRAIVDNIEKRMRNGHRVQPVSFRDCFNAHNTIKAKNLVEKGMAIKRQGNISTFRVICQGLACVPVLETRTNKGQWEVYLQQEDKDNRSQEDKDNRVEEDEDNNRVMEDGESRTAANRAAAKEGRGGHCEIGLSSRLGLQIGSEGNVVQDAILVSFASMNSASKKPATN